MTGDAAGWTNGGPEGRLTVVLPAWRAARFVGRTLEAVLGQTLTDFSLLVVVDGESGDGTAEVAIRRLKRAGRRWRTEVREAPARLGWVGNVNRGLALAGTRRCCLMPHDDWVERRYLAALWDGLDAVPGAAAAYTDIRMTGESSRGASWRSRLGRWLGVGRSHVLREPSLLGARRERARRYLLEAFPALAFRGLVDREVVGEDWRVDGGSCGDFAADTTWGFKLALAGPLVRVPGALYRKRLRLAGAHGAWFKGEEAEQKARWLAHCRDCRAVLERCGGAEWPEARRWLLARLFQRRRRLWGSAYWEPGDRTGRREAVRALFAPW